ncbi:hypothetical protein FISHEDRAFT_38321 [Fistulina hepatica ATCC 64428]|nr:hypothetical protein FISHEDRAFT_38321 [Fistulina hepatica ATCC 64428]
MKKRRHPLSVPPPKEHSAFRYSKCTGKKKAVCIGINYTGTNHRLYGCINDAENVHNFLITKHNFPKGNVLLLTDKPGSRYPPTRKNMLKAMRWLVKDACPHDSLFFHYSGHGGQTPDLDGDETDGLDEVVFPLDYQTEGHILDDAIQQDMHSLMVKPLPAGCRLTALFDSCHSGTVLDLPYIYSAHGRLRGSHVSDRARLRLATPADVISWSGCKDDETSADTFSGGIAVGAMSHAFIETLSMSSSRRCPLAVFLHRRLLYPKYNQKPQLGSSHRIVSSFGSFSRWRP